MEREISHLLRNKRDAYDDGAGLTLPKSITPVILVLVLLIPVHSAYAAVQTTSGVLQLSNTLGNGNTAYSVQYSYPSTADVGTNLNITLTLHVNSLTGLVEYLYVYRLVADVFIGRNTVNGSVSSGSGVGAGNLIGSNHLYAGSNWGPNILTIPLTADNTGLAEGAAFNATVVIRLEDSIWEGYYSTEPPMQGSAGNLMIQNPAATENSSTTSQTAYQTQTYLLYGVLAIGALLMLSAVVLPRGPESPQTNQK
jgi:hypothetical protein